MQSNLKNQIKPITIQQGGMVMKEFFNFVEFGTSYRHEIVGGITTLLSMSYIFIVNRGFL